tara:strand:+ start:455 stop:859 length:405 start_codon:yes stop_codon:yes gene_type:complete
MKIRVFYAMPEAARALGLGWDFAREMEAKHPNSDEIDATVLMRDGRGVEVRLDLTHTELMTVEVESRSDIFGMMQGEVWSSGAKQEAAQDLIRSLGLSHTSMSIGDIVVEEDNHVYMVDRDGYRHLGTLRVVAT